MSTTADQQSAHSGLEMWPDKKSVAYHLDGKSDDFDYSYKGSFTNYVDKILVFLTTYPPALTFSMV